MEPFLASQRLSPLRHTALFCFVWHLRPLLKVGHLCLVSLSSSRPEAGKVYSFLDIMFHCTGWLDQDEEYMTIPLHQLSF